MQKTIDKEDLWQNFTKLNTNQRKQIIEYIKMLNQKELKKHSTIMNQDFISIWIDNEELEDSSDWTKKLEKN